MGTAAQSMTNKAPAPYILRSRVIAMPTYDPPLWTAIAAARWTLLGISVVLGIWGAARRSAGLLFIAGALSLSFSLVAMLSIGRFLLILPLLAFAAGTGFLVRSRRGMFILVGVAVLVYGLQLAVL